MHPTPIFAELTAPPEGAHHGRRRGARSVMDVIREIEGSPRGTVEEPDGGGDWADETSVGRVPGVLSFRLPAQPTANPGAMPAPRGIRWGTSRS